VENSKNGQVKAKVSFYVNLMKEGRYPEPVEDWRCTDKLKGLQAQQEWMDKVKIEIPSLIPARRAEMMRILDIPQIPFPTGLQEWQRKWWRQCWEDSYRQFR
jgi:hypothetical protein